MTTAWRMICIASLVLMLMCEHNDGRRDKKLRKAHRRRSKSRLSDSKLQDLLSGAADDFSVNLYKVLSPDYQNFVFSPIGVHMSLSMAYLASRASTARELQTTLRFMQMKTPRNVHKIFRRLTDSFKNNVKNVTLKVVNAMYVRRSVSLRNRFVRKMRRFYKARVKTFTFRTLVEPEVNINKWIEKRSRKKIKDFMPRQSLTSQTMLMLINAMYFRGRWQYPVDEHKTDKSPFKINRHQSIRVNMMNMEGHFRAKYSSALKCKSLEIPYAGNRFSLFIILPNRIEQLKQLETLLSESNLKDLLNITSPPTRMRVRIPKLKLEMSLSLKSALRSLGIKDIFKAGSADLTGINGKRRSLHVDDVVHKSCIEVNERGTKGVYNGVPMNGSVSNPTSIHVDRPFLFVIRDKIFRINVFIGKLAKPSN